MNIVTSRRRMNPDDRRAQLLTHGVRVFAQLGIGRASHAEVARAAGVSVATVFNYFPSRENLVDQVLSQVDEFLSDMTEKAELSSLPVPEAMYKLMITFANAANTEPDMIRVWLEWSTSIRDDTWPKYLEFQERIIGRLRLLIISGQQAGTVGADVNPEDAARMTVGDAHMVALMQFANRAFSDMDRFLRHMIESVLKVPAVTGG
jgi:TetR/AcrR family transcriptional regulator, hemagglutinin/protease regulatory protein